MNAAAAPAARDPGTVATSAAMRILWAGFTVVVGTLYALLPANPDQQVFDYIGWIASQGGQLYVDSTEQNFPGQLWLHELSTLLFGNHFWSYRLLDYLLLLASLPMLVALLRPSIGHARAFLVAPIYQLMYVTCGPWMAGQRDIVAAPLLIGAALAYRARSRGGGLAWVGLFALCLVYAALIRPTYILLAPIAVLLDAATARHRQRAFTRVLADAGLAAAGCVVAIGAVVLPAWRAGTLAAWYESAICYNIESYSRSQTYLSATVTFFELTRSWHWYLAFGAAGSFLWWRRATDRSALAILAAVGGTAVLSAYVQLKGFPYHMGGLLTVLAVLDSYFIWWCMDRVAGWKDYRRLALAGLVCTIAVLGLGKKMLREFGPQLQWLTGRISLTEMFAHHVSGVEHSSYAQAFEAVEYIKRTVPPDQTVLGWNRAAHINFLSQRRMPHRFATAGMLTGARPPFSAAAAWARELEEVFAHRPPLVILVPARELGPSDEGIRSDPAPSLPTQILRRELAARYEREQVFGAIELYRFQPASADR